MKNTSALVKPDTRPFVARCKHCLRVVGACAVESPTGHQDKVLADWVRAELTIERMSAGKLNKEPLPWEHSETCFGRG